MVKFIVTGVATLLMISNVAVAADVEVFVAPAGWQRSTDSTEEIKGFLSDLKVGNRTAENSVSPELSNALTDYRNQVRKQINGVFTQTELKKYLGTTCKISFTTGKTASTDPTPPEVVTLDFLADNTLPGCKVLTKKLGQLVTHGSLRKYPILVKENGLLSIDMIYVFGKQR